MVPNVPWHRAPRRKGPPAPRNFFFFLGYLIVIYIGNQITMRKCSVFVFMLVLRLSSVV